MRLRSRILGFAAALVGVVAATLTVLAVTGRGSENLTVSVFPIPGGRVAAPQTQITFRGVMSGHIGRVIVTGSSTGRHTGRVIADSDRQGASFLPAKPFAPGEVVTVKTTLHIPGTRAGTFHFTIAHPAGAIPVMPLDPAPRVAGDEFTFHSRPDLTPPAVEVTKQSGNAAPGDIFITPQQGPTQNGVMILNGQGALVWFQPIKPPNIAADLRVQQYQGKPVLTWWQGYSGAGVGAGEDLIYDSSYRQVAVVHAGNGLTADLHEFHLTPQGTALITAFYPVLWNASALHGSSQQVVLDSVVQEIDIKTGLVVYQWDSLDHIPLVDTYEAMPRSATSPFDYFHVNSVQLQQNGDLLISARNTWAAYDIDHATGAIVWTLGGRKSSFKLSSGAVFAFQHDVRLHTDTDPTVTLFDDGGGPPRVHTESRAITVRLDSSGKKATLVNQNQHSPALAAAFEGNVQALPGGDQFVGWGQQPYFSEYNAKGEMMFDARFVDSNSSYRAYRFPWVGKPTGAPAVATTTQGGTTNVYVSWNGATQVASWRVLAGSAENALQAVVTTTKQGFENQIAIATEPYVAVQALDAAGRTLATSSVVNVT
jgi:Arylsulfotransferase (ASST)